MAKATRAWFCDQCGDLIKHPKDGWVEWITFPRAPDEIRPGRDLRLVHHRPASESSVGCQFIAAVEHAKDRGSVADLPLRDFLGPDGLARLLGMISGNELPTEVVITMIQRLHIPGYEQARFHFDRLIEEGVIEPLVPPDHFRQDTIDFVRHVNN